MYSPSVHISVSTFIVWSASGIRTVLSAVCRLLSLGTRSVFVSRRTALSLVRAGYLTMLMKFVAVLHAFLSLSLSLSLCVCACVLVFSLFSAQSESFVRVSLCKFVRFWGAAYGRPDAPRARPRLPEGVFACLSSLEDIWWVWDRFKNDI